LWNTEDIILNYTFLIKTAKGNWMFAKTIRTCYYNKSIAAQTIKTGVLFYKIMIYKKA